MSNALWIARISTYIQSTLALASAEVIIDLKIRQRSALLAKYKITNNIERIQGSTSAQDILLYEARAAKQFWSFYRALVPVWAKFRQRKPHAKDVTNQLLDIGYHHITRKVIKNFEQRDLSLALGLLHAPHTAGSTPLAYDIVELFRADLVDAEVLRFLRLKKRPVAELSQKDIQYFLRSINKRLERKFYLKDFKQCHSYEYYLDLQITKVIKAVNHQEVFNPIYPPLRHDSSCA